MLNLAINDNVFQNTLEVLPNLVFVESIHHYSTTKIKLYFLKQPFHCKTSIIN